MKNSEHDLPVEPDWDEMVAREMRDDCQRDVADACNTGVPHTAEWGDGYSKGIADERARVAKELHAKANTMEAEDTGEDADASDYVEYAAHALHDFAFGLEEMADDTEATPEQLAAEIQKAFVAALETPFVKKPEERAKKTLAERAGAILEEIAATIPPMQRFERMVASGLIDADGNYLGPVASMTSKPADGSVDESVSELPACLCCEATEGVEMESSRTQYPWDGNGDDPNAPLPLCRPCAKEHHEHWDWMWKDYWRGVM